MNIDFENITLDKTEVRYHVLFDKIFLVHYHSDLITLNDIDFWQVIEMKYGYTCQFNHSENKTFDYLVKDSIVLGEL